MNPSANHTATGPLGLSPVVAGTACCVLSALGYTAANICMRHLAGLRCDEMWVTAVKETVTVAVVGPWLLAQGLRRLVRVPPWRALAGLTLVGLLVQLGGNLSMQWAYGKVGLAVTISGMFGMMLIASASLGRLMLKERVSARSATAILLLLASLALLAVGAPAAARSISADASASSDRVGDVPGGEGGSHVVADGHPSASQAGRDAHGLPGPLAVALGVGAACLAGAVYAILTVAIRTATSRAVPVTTIVFIITGMGVLSLGALSVWRFGTAELLATPPRQMAWMLAAGACNLIAFLAITKGLQLTTVVHANLLNASQVAMGAVAGMAFFHESRSPWVIMGVCLTVVGLLLIRRRPDERIVDQHA